MIYGTKNEISVAIEFLRRMQLKSPDLNIRLHDLARDLEALSAGCEDGQPITSKVAVTFERQGEIRLHHGRAEGA